MKKAGMNWDVQLSHLRINLLLFAASFAGGCSTIQGAKLLAPQSFGLEQVAPNIYVESGADEVMRSRLREAMDKAEKAIRTAYGGVIHTL